VQAEQFVDRCLQAKGTRTSYLAVVNYSSHARGGRIRSTLVDEFSKLVAKDLSYGRHATSSRAPSYGSGTKRWTNLCDRQGYLSWQPGQCVWRSEGKQLLYASSSARGRCVQTGKAAGAARPVRMERADKDLLPPGGVAVTTS
jgi:hypothetical protein